MKLLCSILFSICTIPFAYCQLLVNNKNLNEDKDVEYIQFSFYYEGKRMNPIYSIDHGTVLREDQQLGSQKISIDNEEVSSRMTPAYIFNKLYKAGWEYVGDGVFMKAPLVENSQTYTFRRRRE